MPQAAFSEEHIYSLREPHQETLLPPMSLFKAVFLALALLAAVLAETLTPVRAVSLRTQAVCESWVGGPSQAVCEGVPGANIV